MENNSSVNIFLRIRSPQLWEAHSPAKSYIDFAASTEQMVIVEKSPFVFDKIFYPESTQGDVFASVERNVDNLIKGYNSGIFALGASGSGKTSTIFGLNGSKGLIAQCLESLFEKLQQNFSGSLHDYSVSVQIIEIYNEKVFDLLTDQTNEIYTKGSTYTGSKGVPIRCQFDAEELLKKANKNRHVRSTLNNASSSRSHAMFTICLNIKSENAEIASLLHLVDLAGSEGVRTTNHSGMAQQEGVKINQGLLALGKVIEAHNSGKKLIPYRDSVLTTVLKDCLVNAESFLTLFACISPARKNKNETLSTIRFAQKCKSLDTKVVPEMNSYLKEQQRLNVRTPLKAFMMPLHRNEAKTPGKQKTKTPLNKTGTRFNSFITPSAVKTISNKHSRHTVDSKFNHHHHNTHRPKESINNTTFSILNASTSTDIDDAPTTSQNSSLLHSSMPAQFTFSPLLRQIESTIDRKLSVFMVSMRNTTANGPEKASTLCVDIRQAVRNGIQELESSFKDATCNDDTFEVPACSSTVVRPANTEVFNKEMQFSRASRRLTSIDFQLRDEVLANDTVVPTAKVAPHRNVKVFEAVTSEEKKMITTNAPLPRRSTRISVMQTIVASKSQHTSRRVKEVSNRNKEKQQCKNKLLAAYMNNSGSALPILSKKELKHSMLELLNEGSMKELQFLPGIGQKTAFEIILKRSVKGKYKTLEDVKKMLSMKDKSWDKFLEKNMLK